MVKLCVPKKGFGTPMSLNMRNSTISLSAMRQMSIALSNPAFYISALSFKFCYLEFSDIMLLADGMKFNQSLVKLDMSNNGIKSCVIRFLLEALCDNYTLADWNVSGNFLDDEFAGDLAHLLEEN